MACVPGGAPIPQAGLPGAGMTPEVITATPLDAALPAEAPPEAPPEVTPPEVVPQSTPVPVSAQEAACLKQGRLWVRAGETSVFACVRKTRDSGKQCTRGTECDGLCLARSRTCAPFVPLLGCHDILQDDGSPTRLCLN